VSRRPEFDELVDGVENAEEEARLRRVHDLLVETEPPPELSSTLLKPPPPRGHVLFPRRRLSPRLVLTGAAVFAAFLIGLLAGSPGSDQEGPAAGIKIARTVQLEGEGDADGAIGIGVRDAKGNLPMVITVWGLDHLTEGDYYTLALTRKGKPIVTCGTFNVSGDRTTVRMIAAYDLKRFDGWAVMLWDAQTRGETRVLSSDRI
jgi:hypothetical protein